jgi:hypothetical protein
MQFDLLIDLGTITAPDNYIHETRLTTFREQNRQKFYHYDRGITDANFPNPSRILKPGDELRVRAFKQVFGGTTTSEERMAFLATQKAIFTGVQGLSLVFDQKRDQLRKDRWYASFDERDCLFLDNDGWPMVPSMSCPYGYDFALCLKRFGHVWYSVETFLCFNES